MKYNYKLPTIFKIFIAIACATTLATAIYYVFKCFSLFGLPQGSVAINVAGTIVCLILFVLAVSLYSIKYKICGPYFCQKYLFFDLFSKRVLVKDILNLVYKKSINKLYFSYYIPNADDPIIVLVSIDTNKIDSFVNTIKQANPNVIYFEEE